MITPLPASQMSANISISRVLCDDPDYLGLSSAARLTLFVIKIRVLPSWGWDVKPLLGAEVAYYTGIAPAEADSALAELESRGWLVRHAGVVWLVNGLRFEPNRRGPKYHKAAVHAFRVLQKGPVKDAIAAHYGPYLEGELSYEAASRTATTAVSDAAATDAVAAAAAAKSAAPKLKGRTTWMTPLWDLHVELLGGEPQAGQFLKAMKPLVDKHGMDLVLKGMRSYLEKTDTQYVSWPRFSATFGVHAGLVKPVAKSASDHAIDEEIQGILRAQGLV